MIDIANVITVNVSQAPIGLGEYKVNNIGLFTDETPPAGYGDYGIYVSAAAVGDDWGTTSETYKQAVAIFSQQPNILAGGGSLIVFPFNPTTAGMIRTFTINAVGSGYSVNDVLTVVQSGGSLGTIKVLSVDGSGAILSAEILVAGSGYAVATGLETTVAPSGGTGAKISITGVSGATETLEEAIDRAQALIFFCGILSTNYGSNTTWADLADSVQAYGDKILFLPSATYSDVAGLFTTIQQASDSRTRCLLHQDSALDARLYAAAYASKLLSVNFDGSNTAITMNLKSLSTVNPDAAIDQTKLTACLAAGVDVYIAYAGDNGGIPAVVSSGANQFADSVANLIWFVSQLKVNGFNALRLTSTKVPQTEPGMSVLKGAYRRACEQARSNGFIAPGTWTSAETFGNLDDFLKNINQYGYYIYSQPISQQSQADRALRKAPLVQIAIKEAGAVHSTIVNVVDNA